MSIRTANIAAFSVVLGFGILPAIMLSRSAHAQGPTPISADRLHFHSGDGSHPRPSGRFTPGGTPITVAAAFKTINPTDDQKAKYQALDTKRQQDLKVEGANTVDIDGYFTDDVEALLTPQQLPKFKEELAIAPVLTMLHSLKLTPDEVEKVKPAIKDTALQLNTVWYDRSIPRADRRAKVEVLYAEVKARIKPLLTPEQQTRLETISFLPHRSGGTPAPPARTTAPQ